MIDINNDDNSFSVKYKGRLFLNHSPKSPLLELGVGNSSYKMRHGNFSIKDKLDKRMPLLNFEIKKKEDNETLINFENNFTIRIVEENNKLNLYFDSGFEKYNRLWLKLFANKEEKIYGCGEQYSELNLRGKKVPLWCEEQGVGRGKYLITLLANIDKGAGGSWYSTYYPQPSFISTDNYFCFVDTHSYALFDFSKTDYHTLHIWNIPDKIVLGKENSACQTVSNFNHYIGIQPDLPDWVYDGVWLGLQGGKETINKKLNKALENDVKVSALWVQDWVGKRMTSFGSQLMWNWKYDNSFYKDLPEYIKELNAKGIKFLGYINPFLAIEKDLYKIASEKGYLIKDKENKDYLVYITDFPASQIDLTNPEAVDWIKEIIKKNMIDIGLSGWMADFGEYLPVDAELKGDDSADSYHNIYPVLWAKANKEAIEESGKTKDILFFVRAGYSHTSKYAPMVWAGDQLVNWCKHDGLRSVIPAALSLGFSGIGFHHSDIGGYTTVAYIKREKELFIRWAEHSAFTILMRTHEGNRPDRNWQFDSDEETLSHFSRMSRIHKKLKPYLKHCVKEYINEGLPVMRHPYIHYEEDHELHKYQYQYLLGRDLLISPVYKPKKNLWSVYLPDDNWIHLWSGKTYNKGRHKVSSPIGQIPVFYRLNSEWANLFKEIALL